MSEESEKNGAEGGASSGEETNETKPEAAPPDPVAEAKAEAARFKDQWMRSAADFDNFRKRTRRELDDTRKAGREELLKDLLPVFDNLERAIASADRATEVKPVADGLKMVLRQFMDTLGRSGITKVSTTGSMFDPSVHEAIQQIESDEPAGTIVSEVQPGYQQGERLIRAAMVVVAKPKAQSENAASGDGEAGKTDA
ncbi:MAG: nucleotide exchange factor GrpE [Deltaproteobacteria bacterium]|nr:nucleotide exchange factor GrpE [Deltaproteobacteria bacterium]